VPGIGARYFLCVLLFALALALAGTLMFLLACAAAADRQDDDDHHNRQTVNQHLVENADRAVYQIEERWREKHRLQSAG
jgi:outer membrane biogenesis lipoprotein LolB